MCDYRLNYITSYDIVQQMYKHRCNYIDGQYVEKSWQEIAEMNK